MKCFRTRTVTTLASMALLAALGFGASACTAQSQSPIGSGVEPQAPQLSPDAAPQAAVDVRLGVPPPTATPIQLAWPKPQVDCTIAKCVALTYDDGPGKHTEELLDHFADADAKATLFMLGKNAKSRPEVVIRAAAEGHAIANHTWDHANLRTLSRTKQKAQLDKTASLLRELSDQPVTMMRPPYLAFNDDTVRLGFAVVLQDVNTKDWQTLNTSTTVKKVLDGVRPGSIVLMHDVHKSTVDAAPAILRELNKRGYHMVTVPELLGEPEPNKLHFRQR